MDKEITLLTYIVITFVIAIFIMVAIYNELLFELEHQLAINISTCIGIMSGIITSFVIYTIQQHFNKR